MNLTVADCVNEARKYTKKIDFRRGSPIHYTTARRLKCLDQCHEHMIVVKKMWTNEELFLEALKYSTRKDFRKSKAHAVAYERGILDNICSHMKAKQIPWTRERIAQLVEKYTKLLDFCDSESSAYTACVKYGWKDLLKSLETNRWQDSELYEIAKKYKYTWEMLKYEPKAYAVARKRGLLDKLGLIKARKPADRPEPYWNIDRIREAAKQCKTKEEFRERFPTASKWASNLRLFGNKDIFGHFTRKVGSSIYELFRSKDECASEALKYTTMGEFKNNSRRQYNYVRAKGWVEELCKHMVRGACGFNNKKVGYFYILAFGDWVGFGITNKLKKRLSTHKTTLAKGGLTYDVLQIVEFTKGLDAERIEKKLKSLPNIVDSGFDGFRTECVKIHDSDKLLRTFENLLTTSEGLYKILQTH